MASRYNIDLSRSGHDVPWGLRLQGGGECGSPLSVQRVFSGTPADGNIQRGDVVLKVNGSDVSGFSLAQAQELIKVAGNRLSLFVQRDDLHPQGHHIANQAPSFAPSAHHPPSEHSPTQPTHHFPGQSSGASQFAPNANVSNIKFQPKSDFDDRPLQQQHFQQPQQHFQQPQQHFQQPQQNFQHHYHQTESVPNASWQPTHMEENSEEHSGDVDADHLRPVKEIKSMFNDAGSAREGSNIVRKGHPVRMNQPTKKTGPSKYQPPSPLVKPPANTRTQSLKQPPVYQQRSSYNPLDFRGVNLTPKSPIPPNRPPGLIQRGAIDTKPIGTAMDYQRPHQPQPHHPQPHPQPHHPAPHHHQTHPTAPSHGNVDSLNDFYLHGLNAKSELPDFTQSTHPYQGKVLPPRTEVAIRTPTGAVKKKEFKADQSAVYRILQEEEEDAKQHGRGGQREGQRGAQRGGSSGEREGRAYQMPAGSQSRLAELLEKDQAQVAPYQDGDQFPQQVQQFQHHPQQQPHKHLMTSTAQFTPSPSREQPPRHDYNDYQNYSHQSHQQNWHPREVGGFHGGHSGLPETDF